VEQGIAALQHCGLYIIVGGGRSGPPLVGNSLNEEEAPDQIVIHHIGQSVLATS